MLWPYAAVVSCGFGLWTWFVFRPGTWLAWSEEEHCQRYLDRSVSDPVLRRKLQPTGRFGSKRPLVSANFYDLMQRGNEEVAQERLVKVFEHGLVSEPFPAPDSKPDNAVAGKQTSGIDEQRTSREFDTII